MKKTILTLTFALATLTFCIAQQIEMERTFSGYKYTQNGTPMTIEDLAKILESNQKAFVLIKKAHSNNTIASIFGSAGGFLVGWPIGSALGGEDANWTLAKVGAGLIAISIPFSSGANKNSKQAIELYNSSLNSTSFYEFKPELKIIRNENGIGLSMNF